MKSLKKENLIKLRKALAAAYHEKEKTEVGELWQMKVMSHIRGLTPFRSGVDYFELFERFVWRLAPVACALILVLALAITQLNFNSDYRIAELFIEDPADFSLWALFNTT